MVYNILAILYGMTLPLGVFTIGYIMIKSIMVDKVK